MALNPETQLDRPLGFHPPEGHYSYFFSNRVEINFWSPYTMYDNHVFFSVLDEPLPTIWWTETYTLLPAQGLWSWTTLSLD